jgi:hypothetical protein
MRRCGRCNQLHYRDPLVLVHAVNSRGRAAVCLALPVSRLAALLAPLALALAWPAEAEEPGGEAQRTTHSAPPNVLPIPIYGVGPVPEG